MATTEDLRRLALDIATEEVRNIEFTTVDDVAFRQGIELSEEEMEQVHDLVIRATVTIRDE